MPKQGLINPILQRGITKESLNIAFDYFPDIYIYICTVLKQISFIKTVFHVTTYYIQAYDFIIL